mmetsp:Transcript_38852/g.51197  ORF Transcript_38852/g.51197 Transcript_38852/m.51197 type:complete len:250 (-) Transcript_38852:90-839(-)
MHCVLLLLLFFVIGGGLKFLVLALMISHLFFLLVLSTSTLLFAFEECRFFLVRHGQSYPNVDGRIVSSLENGVKSVNGLTDFGHTQARNAGQELYENLVVKSQVPKENILVISSPFSRAKETAEEIQSYLGCDIQIDSELRERWFGSWDEKADDNYENVWAEDAKDSKHTEFGVESVEAVARRTVKVLKAANQNRHSDHQIQALILVSHGDALQILQTSLLRKDLRTHRSLPHLNNCEVREVFLQRDIQ